MEPLLGILIFIGGLSFGFVLFVIVGFVFVKRANKPPYKTTEKDDK